ncbi:MAG: metal-dependent transcriptional regulator [Candidatus Dadabacteria bacterium]|nr:metal-dependent transcriptional regulator [Candidatus Dadabacteria bacterium]
MVSPTIEDYLKAIYKLQKRHGRVTTSAIAEKLTLSNATVTAMIKRLAKKKLLKHISYHGVVLTNDGEQIALKVIRRHRLVESFLKEVLGVDWDKVHSEAEKLEHFISDEILERIDHVLGYPKTDLHGDPIPTKDGEIESVEGNQPLSDAEIGNTVVISCVSDGDPKKLRFMAQLGLFPGVSVGIRDKAPFEGDLFIRVGKYQHRLPREVARDIYVTQAKEK